jgi:hypothetical protein
MVSVNTRTEAANPLASLTHSSSSSSSKTNSFAQQLAGVIKSEIQPSLNGSQAGSRASEVARQNSGNSQILVATKPAATTAAAASEEEIPTMLGMGPAAGTAPVASKASSTSATKEAIAPGIPSMLGMGPAAGTSPVTSTLRRSSLAGTTAVSTALKGRTAPPPTKVPAAQSTVPQPVGSSPGETEADAYWAQQPAAVQVLRGMPDDNAKEKLALKLANQGYSIDTQIMVWNWDPQMTMQVRENQGYAWVPSFGQSNIPIGPGLSMPGMPNSYSPNSPPAGSIQVSTAFAVGTIQNPLVQVDPVGT